MGPGPGLDGRRRAFPGGSAGRSCLRRRSPGLRPWVGKIPWRRERLPTPVVLGFPCGSAGKESTCTTGAPGSVPGLGRSSGEGKGYLLQYSGLEKSMDCIVHGVAKSWIQLSHFHFRGPKETVSLKTLHPSLSRTRGRIPTSF